MKVKRSITLDSELEKKIKQMVDSRVKRAVAKEKNINSKKLRMINQQSNFSVMIEELVKTGMQAKKDNIYG